MNTPEEYIKDKVNGFAKVIPYDAFCDIAVFVAHNFEMKLDEATQLIHSLRGDKEIGSQEYTWKGFGKNNKWQGQEAAQNFSKTNPGELAEPKASLGPLSSIEILSYKKDDIVRVLKNDQAPWGAEYTGVIEQIKPHNAFDIRDLSTDELYVDQPAHLLRNPIGEGRPDVRIQQRRVGDPKGMGESQLDNGDPNAIREYPNQNWMPNGQADKDVKNPKSQFYKEASHVLKEFGRVKRPSNGATGIVLKINDNKPGDIDVLVLWDIPHLGHNIFETDIGDIEPLNEEASEAAIAKAKEHLEKHLKDKETYEKNFKDELAGVKKEAHCGPCTPLKMKAIEMLSDMHYKSNNFDRKYLGQLGAQSEEENNEGFVKTLREVLKLIKPDKDNEGVLTKLNQIATTLEDIQYRIQDGEFKAVDKPKVKADKLYSFLLHNIVKEYGEDAANEVVSYLQGAISTPSKTLSKILTKYNIIASKDNA